MTIFNPDAQPSQVPNFIGSTRPISPQEGNKAWGTLFAGIGNIVEQGITGADLIMKSHIKNKEMTQIDETRDAFMDDLVKSNINLKLNPKVKKVPGVGVDGEVLSVPEETVGALGYAPEEVSSQSKPSLLNDDNLARTLPSELDNLEDKLTNLKAAQQSGKFTPTLYQMKLLSIAKNLRSQYPGYRDYIDEVMQHTTGINPANATIRSLIAENNQMQQQLAGAGNKIETLFMAAIKEGMPGSVDMYRAWKNGGLEDGAALTYINSQHARNWTYKQWEQERSVEKGDRELLVNREKTRFNQRVANDIADGFNTVMVSIGAGKPQGIFEFFDAVNSGAIKIKPEETLAIAQKIAAEKRNAYKAAREAANKPDSSGLSSVAILGADEVEKTIAENLKIYDMAIAAVHNKDYGTAVAMANWTKARVSSLEGDVLKDDDIGAFTGMHAALKNLVGPDATKFLMETWLREKNPFKNYDITNKMKLITQAPVTIQGTQIPMTLNSVTEDMRTKKLLGTPGSAQLINGYIKYTSSLADKDFPGGDAAKANLARAMFDPTNLGFVSKIKSDAPDPAKPGRLIPGAQSAYVRMSSLPVLQEVHRLSQTQDPTLWKDAKNWVEHSFTRELFPREIKNLNNFTESARFRIAFDNESHQFILIPKETLAGSTEGGAITSMPAKGPIPGYAIAKQSIDRINFGLQGIINISKIEGTNPDAYILNMLAENGVDLTKLDGNLFEKMGRAVISTTKMQQQLDQNLSTQPWPGRQK